MELKEIRSLVDLMKKNGIAVFKLERQNFKITLKTSEAAQPVVQAFSPNHNRLGHPIPPPPPELTAAAAPPDDAPTVAEIKSPMVGTFYAAPAPDAPPFVKVGQAVTPDTVVCIIEAMKVMNEVKAEVSGTIAEVCAENGRPVQFGQTLFRLK